MKKIGILLIVSLLLFGCTKQETNLAEDNNLIKTNEKYADFIIVDVRTKEEYDEGHIEGAINIPYDEIDENTNLDKNKTIMVYCKSGVRSNKAYNTLKELGYDVIDLGAYASIDMSKIKD